MPRRSIRVTFADGNSLETEINGTEDEIRRYYVGQPFNFGDTDAHPADNLQCATAVEFLDAPKLTDGTCRCGVHGWLSLRPGQPFVCLDCQDDDNRERDGWTPENSMD